jgi:hypothetical protein
MSLRFILILSSLLRPRLPSVISSRQVSRPKLCLHFSSLLQFIIVTIIIQPGWPSLVPRLRAGWQGLNSWQGQCRIGFSSPPRPERLWGPPSFLPIGYRHLSPDEADHLICSFYFTTQILNISICFHLALSSVKICSKFLHCFCSFLSWLTL